MKRRKKKPAPAKKRAGPSNDPPFTCTSCGGKFHIVIGNPLRPERGLACAECFEPTIDKGRLPPWADVDPVTLTARKGLGGWTLGSPRRTPPGTKWRP